MKEDEMLFRNLTREEQGNIAQHLVEQEKISVAVRSFQIEGLGCWNSWHDKKPALVWKNFWCNRQEAVSHAEEL